MIPRKTAAEIDNAGFNVWRARGKNGEYRQINSILIPAKGSPQEGAVYEYTDTPDRPGVVSHQGEGIILVAGAGHGKTTLTLELVKRGFLTRLPHSDE